MNNIMILFRILLTLTILVHVTHSQNSSFLTFNLNIPNSLNAMWRQINNLKPIKKIRLALGTTKLGYILSLELAEKNDTHQNELPANYDTGKNVDGRLVNKKSNDNNPLNETKFNEDKVKGKDNMKDKQIDFSRNSLKERQFYGDNLKKKQLDDDHLKEKPLNDDDLKKNHFFDNGTDQKKKQFYGDHMKTSEYHDSHLKNRLYYADHMKQNQFYDNILQKKQFVDRQQGSQFYGGYLIKKQIYEDRMKKKRYHDDLMKKYPFYGDRFKKKLFYDDHQNGHQIDYTLLNKKYVYDHQKNLRTSDENDGNDLDLFRFNVKGLKDAIMMLKA